ncbi:MAG: M23 family metallopeptidase [Kofleriaceae bacterium]
MKSLFVVALLAGSAAADVRVTPESVAPGDPVVVTVTDANAAPHGKAGGQALTFMKTKSGYQAVFAAPLAINEDHVLVEVTGSKPISVPLSQKTFPETDVVVEDELANPSPADGKIIDQDNHAIAQSYVLADGSAQFVKPFKQPIAKITSTFGEWRTFNDGHRSQHLGTDYAVSEGTPVRAIDSGTVTLVRETFLAGNVVVVAHGGGISSLYFHLQKPSVKTGDHVQAGATIGRAGHTGRTTGPHLHLSIHVPGGMVDPVSFFALPLAK